MNDFSEKCSENPSDLSKQVPTCMCVLCDIRLYKKGLIIFNESDYENDTERLIFQMHKKNPMP